MQSSDIYNFITCNYKIIKKTFCAGTIFKYSPILWSFSLKSTYARIPSIINFTYGMFYWFLILTLFSFCFQLPFFIFYYQLHICIDIEYVLLMFLFHSFLLSYWIPSNLHLLIYPSKWDFNNITTSFTSV